MPLIQVTMIEGRSVQKKKAFYQAVTQAAVENLNVNPQQVRVVLNEVSAKNWIVGGKSKAEIDLDKS